MRYRFKSLPILMLVVFGALSAGIAGCTKDPVSKEKSPKTEQIVKLVLPEVVKTDDTRRTDDTPKKDAIPKQEKPGDIPDKAKEPGKKANPADDKEPISKEVIDDRLRAKELVAKQLALLTTQDTKKDKDVGKEPKKDKDGKDPKKDKDKDKDKDKPPPEVYDYLGHSFNEWKKKIHDKDPSVREVAMKAMLVFGTDKAYSAVEDILGELRKNKPGEPIDLAVAVNGTLTLSTIFAHKKDPDPKLIKEAIPVYKMFLNHSQVIMKVRAVQALPALGPDARQLLGDVIKLVNEPMTWEVRKEATQVMAYMALDDKGVPDKRVTPELLRRLKTDKSAEVRTAALNGIARIGRMIGKENLATVLIEVRNTCSNDDNVHVKITAHLTMLSLEHDPKAGAIAQPLAQAHLVPLVNIAAKAGSDPSERIKALHAIAVVGPLAKPWAYPSIMKMIDDSNVAVGVQACMTLLPMRAYEARPALKAIVEDKKASEILKDAAEDVYDHLKLMKDHEEKEKAKEKDKKAPEKK